VYSLSLCLSDTKKIKSGKRKKGKGKRYFFFYGVITKRLIAFIFILERKKKKTTNKTLNLYINIQKKKLILTVLEIMTTHLLNSFPLHLLNIILKDPIC
jgi:hypothetical protein